MTVTAELLASLDVISLETTNMFRAIDGDRAIAAEDRREVKRRILEIRSEVHELSAWLSAMRLEEPKN